MSIVKCPQCNLVNFAGVVSCKRCNFQLEKVTTLNQPPVSGNEPGQSKPVSFNHAPPAQPPPVAFNQYPQTPAQQIHYGSNYEQQSYRVSSSQSKKLAIISLIFGILSFPMINLTLAGILSVVLAIGFGTVGALVGFLIVLSFLPTGLISGIVALVRAKKRPSEFGGKGFAIAGIVLSSFAILVIPLVAAIAVPNLLAARRSANEAAAISSMRTIYGAEITYQSTAGKGGFGDLNELGNNDLISTDLAKGIHSGYIFTVAKSPNGFEIFAKPAVTQGVSSSGNRSFYYSSEDDILRAANKNGQFADKTDLPLESNRNSDSPPKVATR